MHFFEHPRTGMTRGECPDPCIITSPRARECTDPYIFVSPAHRPAKTVARGVPGSIHFYQSPRTTVRRKASAASGRTCSVDIALQRPAQ